MENLPSDPKDIYYLTNCFACKEKAKPEQEFIRNYGGVVCFSCRAFFRRANQKGTPPNFTCKRGGGCGVTAATGRKCQKCRMDKCLIAGMSKDAILNEEQKKKRFRKMLQKRMQEQQAAVGQPSQRDEQQPSTSRAFVSAPRPGPSWMDMIPPLIPIMKDRSSQTPADMAPDPNKITNHLVNSFKARLQENPGFVWQSSKTSKNPPKDNHHSKVIMKKITTMVISYQKTLKSTISSFQSNLSSIGSSVRTIRIKRQEVLKFILKLTEDYKQFAIEQRRFKNLPHHDQLTLVTRNSPLFIQLQLATLVWGPDLKGKESLPSKPAKKQWMKNYKLKQDLERFNASANLFRDGCDLDTYARLMSKVKFFCRFNSVEKTALLAYLILFDYDPKTKFSCEDDLSDILIENEILFETIITDNKHSPYFQELMSTLVQMALFCSYYINWDGVTQFNSRDTEVKPPPTGIIMPYTREEEFWLFSQTKQLENAYRSVQLGQDFVDEFVMFSLGIPFSRTFFSKYTDAAIERKWRILRMHPEFQDLPVEMKLKIMRNNCMNGIALIAVRGEYSTGLKQIQYGVGEMDEVKFMDKYMSYFKNLGEMKSITFSQSPCFTHDQRQDYLSLIKLAKILHIDPELFKLNLLIAMTRPVPGVASSFANVHFTYVNLLKRHLNHLSNSTCGSALNHIKDPEEFFSQTMLGIESLKNIIKYLVMVLKQNTSKFPFQSDD